jgi:hypothetical protein
MYTDETILSLADGATVLSLYTGRMRALLNEAGLVDDPDTMLVWMSASNVLLEAVASCSFVPAKEAEKLLQVSRGFADGVGHRLNAFTGQVAELALNVHVKISTRCDSTETVIKLTQELGQFRLDPHNNVRIHADSPFRMNSSKRIHRLAA